LGLVLALAILAGGLPPVLGWLFVGRAPSISPAEASTLVSADDSPYVLVDVRTPSAYAEASIQESVPLPYAQIRDLADAADLPRSLLGRSLVLLCDGGVLSARAALNLRALGVSEVLSVRGGLQAWIATASTSDSLLPLRVDEQDDAPALNPVVRLPVAEQATLVLALYAVKPLYMLLAAWLVWALWPKKTIVLTALRWSLICFFVGELACWINFQFLTVESITLEYVHSFSMTFFIAFLTYALIEAVDRDLLHYTAPAARCALAGYCHRCRKSADVPCVLRRLFQLGCVSLAALSLIPLTAAPNPVSYNAGIFGLVRNLMHPVAVQLYEIRFAPAVAFLLFAAAALLLAFGRHKGENSAVVLIAAGTGHLGFAFFRLAFLSFFPGDLVRFVAWEELTELLMIAALAYALWVFRVELLPRRTLHRLLG
jgi:rhodanese-related sulfurtransferase